ncbi:MAG: cell division protein SepF, partial [bacterium]|nr:cell division protein SepF [bacterium]
MKLIERIVDALGLYDDAEDDILEEELVEQKPIKEEKPEKPEPKFEPAPKKSLFENKNSLFRKKKVEEEVPALEEASAKEAKEEPKVEAAPAKTSGLFNRKKVEKPVEPVTSGKTIAMPIADKQVRVVVIEPSNFDDSQKIADYLRGNQPVVVNFENADNIVTKRMTDFISGTIYALG